MQSIRTLLILDVALKMIMHYYIYSVFFFIELKVFVNLTYLSEIKKQGLIFSVGMGHLYTTPALLVQKTKE